MSPYILLPLRGLLTILLDVDYFCLSIQRELHEITAVRLPSITRMSTNPRWTMQHPNPEPRDFVFSTTYVHHPSSLLVLARA